MGAATVAQAPAVQTAISQAPGGFSSAQSVSDVHSWAGAPSQLTESGALGPGEPSSSKPESHPQAERNIVTKRTDASCLIRASNQARLSPRRVR